MADGIIFPLIERKNDISLDKILIVRGDNLTDRGASNRTSDGDWR